MNIILRIKKERLKRSFLSYWVIFLDCFYAKYFPLRRIEMMGQNPTKNRCQNNASNSDGTNKLKQKQAIRHI